MLFFFVVNGKSLANPVQTKSFHWTDSFPEGLDLYSRSSSKGLSIMAKVKWYQLKGQWQDCTQFSRQILKRTDLDVWPSFVHLSCLRSWYKRDSKMNPDLLMDNFNALGSRKNKLLMSPYQGHKEKLLEVYVEISEILLEKSRDHFVRFIKENSQLIDWMSLEQRGDYYWLMGELAWLRQKIDVAKANFLRSYEFNPQAKTLARLKSLNSEQVLKLHKYSKDIIESPAEAKLWQLFSSSYQSGQVLRTAKYGIEFLNQFPGSRRTETVRNKINIYFKRLLYRTGQKFISSKKDFERTLLQAPPQYLLFWAHEAYDRGYQHASYKLAEKAAEKWDNTAFAADALLLAGRSAYYLTERDKARKRFSQLIEKHSGHSASAEARYFLGLLYYREGDYNKVVKLYDSFLNSSGSDKWELQVRYWLWRALKKNNSRRSEEIADTILKEFPLTYYGLLVRLDKNKSLQSLISQSDKTISVKNWWLPTHEKRWQRIKTLVTNGWVDEAEKELSFLPDPKLAEGYILRAKIWSKALIHNRSIQDYAAAINLDHSFLTDKLLASAFPDKYKKYVVQSEEEFKVSRNLIWAIMRQESAFVPRAVSPSKAYGLMQMLRPTAKETARWLKVKNFNVSQDIYEPAINIRFGSHFISRMIGKYKRVIPLAVASYNVGPGNLDRWLRHREDLKDWQKFGASPDDDMWIDELPWAETSFYVKAVLRNFLLYQIIHSQLDQLPTPAWSYKVSSQ